MGVIKDFYTEAEELLLSNDPEDCAKASGMINVLDRMKEDSYVNKMDWSLLREQKQTLLELTSKFEEDSVEYEHLNGIVELIDAMQDFAVIELNVSEEDVFLYDEEY